MHILIHKQSGLTVIELLIAMVLGLLLTAGISQVYVTTKSSYRLTENLSHVQESARFGMSILSQDVRMAGFIPCLKAENTSNTVDSTDVFFDFFNSSIIGYEGGVSTFPAGFPATGTGAGARVAGTDAIIVSGGGGNETYNIDWHNGGTQEMELDNLYTITAGELALLCDDTSTTLFQVTGVNTTTSRIQHTTTGSISPGNCSANLGGTGECSCSATCFANKTFSGDAQLVKFNTIGYFIGVSSNADGRSLYRRNLNVAGGVAGFQTEEVLRGVENMQILYGQDTDNDSQPDQYLTANNVTDWLEVVSVRLGLLVQSPDPINDVNDTNTYIVAGTPIADTATTITHAGDRRIRYSFTTTVELRNRGLGL